MNALPVGGRDIAPEKLVGLDVFDDFMKLLVLLLIVLSLHIIFHFRNRFAAVFGSLIMFVTVICI